MWTFRHRVTDPVPEVELEVESNECQVVSWKQTEEIQKRLLFSIDYIPGFIFLINRFVRNLNAIPFLERLFCIASCSSVLMN